MKIGILCKLAIPLCFFHLAFCTKLPSFPISMLSIGNFNAFVLMPLYYIIIKGWCGVHLADLMYQRHPRFGNKWNKWWLLVYPNRWDNSWKENLKYRAVVLLVTLNKRHSVGRGRKLTTDGICASCYKKIHPGCAQYCIKVGFPACKVILAIYVHLFILPC